MNRWSDKKNAGLCNGTDLSLFPKRTPLLDQVLHVSMFRCVQLDVVLGQDLHDRPDFQPPLGLGDAVPAADRRKNLTHIFTI